MRVLGTIGILMAGLAAPVVASGHTAASCITSVGRPRCDCSDEPPFVVEASGARHMTGSVATLTSALRTGDEATRRGAARALGRSRSATAVTPLTRALADSSCLVAVAAARALTDVKGAGSSPQLIAALESDACRLRATAAEALGDLGDRRAVRALISAMSDTDKRVRQMAAQSLGKLGDPRASGTLVRALQDPEKHVRQAAADALGRLDRVPAVQADRFAIRAVTLIDGRGGPPERGMTLIVRGRHIETVARDGSATLPAGIRTIDGTGSYVIPGLWDMHVHFRLEGESALRMYIASGVTTVRDAGGPIGTLRAWSREISAGDRVGPRIFASGPMLESPESVRGMRTAQSDTTQAPADRVVVPDAASAARVVDSVAALGVDFIKMRTFKDAATYWAVAAASRRHGLTLVAHPPWGAIDPVAVADSGQRDVEHGFFPSGLDTMQAATRQRMLDAFRTRHVVQGPTLAAWGVRRIPLDSVRRLTNAARTEHRWREHLSPELRAQWGKELARFERERNPNAPDRQLATWNSVLDAMARDIAIMHRSGVPVIAASDVPVGHYPGEALHAELRELVVRSGLTPMQALESATRVPAEFMGVRDSLGTVEAGKLADFILLDADPTADIRNVTRVRAVVRDGIYRDRVALGQLFPLKRSGTSR